MVQFSLGVPKKINDGMYNVVPRIKEQFAFPDRYVINASIVITRNLTTFVTKRHFPVKWPTPSLVQTGIRGYP